jgi:hypothetical protein
MDSRNDDLSKLPDEMLFNIYSLDPPRACDFLSRLPETSTFYSNLYSSFFTERKLAFKLLRKLLGHAVLGEWENAESIYKLFPDLLTCRGTIYHPNRTYEEGKAPVAIPADKNPGRYKYDNCTAWQIALMNAEYEEAELMGKFMTEKEKQKQYVEIFPDGQLIKHNWDLEEAKRRLDAVFDAVIKDQSINENNLDKMNEETSKALAELYAYVKPASEHHTGLVFDENIYLAALQLYEDRFSRFATWDQRTFWCIRVEEHLASLLGTGYLRLHAQGIGNKLKRNGCTLADGSSYFAFRRPSNSVPGGSFFVEYFGEGRGALCLPLLRADGFSNFMSSKNESRDRTYAAIFASRQVSISNLLK